jgi:hypothetical protein
MPFFPKKKPQEVHIEPAERPIIPLPAEVLEDRALTVHAERQLKHWLDEAVEEFAKNGGFDDLPGKGKPLRVPTGSVMDTILLNAGATHPWLLLRKDIKLSLELVMSLLESSPRDPIIDEHLADINRKIAELNYQAPGLSLHRRKVTRANIREQYDKWV